MNQISITKSWTENKKSAEEKKKKIGEGVIEK